MVDERLLDDHAALARVDHLLRGPAGWGAQVRLAAAATAGQSDRLLATVPDRPRAVLASGRGGRLLRAVLEPTCPVPFMAWPHLGLPGWAGPLDLAVAMSPTGQDQGSLSMVAEALRRGAAVLAACPEGSELATLVGTRGTVLRLTAAEPTALAVPVLDALHRVGLGPEAPAEAVATTLDEVAVTCGPSRSSAQNTAKEVALVVGDSVPVLWGGSVLAARVARRFAEMLRPATGRQALAGDEQQVIPVLDGAQPRDIFSDPLEDPGAARPVLLLLDDGADGELESAARERVNAAAERVDVPVHTIRTEGGSEIARFAALLSVATFSTAYCALVLGRVDQAPVRQEQP